MGITDRLDAVGVIGVDCKALESALSGATDGVDRRGIEGKARYPRVDRRIIQQRIAEVVGRAAPPQKCERKLGRQSRNRRQLLSRTILHAPDARWRDCGHPCLASRNK